METRQLGDAYRAGPIQWTADELAPEWAQGRVFRDGELIRLEAGDLAVRFTAETIEGKYVTPIFRLEGRPRLAALAEAAYAAEAEREARHKAEAADRERALKALPDSQFFDTRAEIGQTFRREGQAWTVIGFARKRVWLDFDDEWGYESRAGCRPATADEIAALDGRIELAARRKRARADLDAIAREIRESGEYPAEAGVPEGETMLAGGGERIYGGGRWFVVGPEWIWFVQNNGHDGDDWSANNVRTGGAGAIGHRVPADPVLARRVRDLWRLAYPED